MEQLMVIPGKLPGMNEIIEGAKQCVYNSGKKKTYQFSLDKKRFTDRVMNCAIAQNLKPRTSVRVRVEFREVHLRRDPDNIQAGIKFILDGLVDAGVLPDDKFAHVRELVYGFKDKAAMDEIYVSVEDVGHQQLAIFQESARRNRKKRGG